MPSLPLPDIAALMALFVAAGLGGLVRGFTGFGFAMVFMPIATSVVPPPMALAIIFLIDAPYALVLGARALPKADRRGVFTLLAAATLFFPIGLALLTRLDPVVTRWVISGLIVSGLILLASGWRYHGRPGLPLTLGAGATSGLFNGLASLSGMPLALFWLSSQTKRPADIRADMQSYLGLSTLISSGILLYNGILSWQALATGLVLMPIYGIGMFLGTKGFHLASEETFRRIAYAVILLAALLSLPLLDGIIR